MSREHTLVGDGGCLSARAYFDGLDHGLGTIAYFNSGKPSAGYAAIFEFMKRYQRR